MFAWLSAKALFGIPRGAWVVAAFVIAVAGFMIWLDARERAAVRADRAVAAAQATATAREADNAAHGAVAGKQKEVEDGNDRARAAAEAGDDPLGDGLRSLRR